MGAPPMGAPPMGAPPMGAPPMGAPPMGAPPMGAPPMGAPPMGGQPATEQVRPLQSPPYLASETAARMDAPVDPWAGTLKLVMLVFGVLLIAAFAAPWSLGEKTVFSWTGLKDLSTFEKVFRIMIAGTGALAIVMALLPLASLGRGIAAAVLGLAPLIYPVVGAPGDFHWQELLRVVGAATLVGGLLVRSQYRTSMAGRILTTVGAICVMLPYLIPTGGASKPPIVDLFKMVGDAEGKAKLIPIIEVVPFVLAIVSLIVWLPSSSSAMGTPLAWIWIVWAMAKGVLLLILAESIGPALKGGLVVYIWIPCAAMAWNALAGYGVATAVGKNLEHA